MTEFLLKDYELKVQCLGEHLQRMWMRFNFFVTLQSGLAAALAIVGTDDGDRSATPYLLGAQAALALIWWVFGAQDRFLVVEYRASIDETATLISDIARPNRSPSAIGSPASWKAAQCPATFSSGG